MERWGIEIHRLIKLEKATRDSAIQYEIVAKVIAAFVVTWPVVPFAPIAGECWLAPPWVGSGPRSSSPSSSSPLSSSSANSPESSVIMSCGILVVPVTSVVWEENWKKDLSTQCTDYGYVWRVIRRTLFKCGQVVCGFDVWLGFVQCHTHGDNVIEDLDKFWVMFHGFIHCKAIQFMHENDRPLLYEQQH